MIGRTSAQGHNLHAALYMRLSVEDGDGGESTSVATQRKILHAYAQAHGFAVFDEYVDDGYSGTNFERPAFQRMLYDIARGHVNLVMTKDLSRLGRNSARTADLIDEYFPAHKVRYISVVDGYDSEHLTGSAALAAPLVLAMHEMYARDASHKIRSALAAKMQNGEFIGSFAPFGYEKDAENHNHLIPDPIASRIVQRIFQLACQGERPAQIARTLNDEAVPPPLLYRHSKFTHITANGRAPGEAWSPSGVRKLLKNQTYLGHTLQGKYTKPSFKSKTSIVNPQETWILTQNTHTPLVDIHTWESVQRHLQSRTQVRKQEFTNIFSGLARCANCGRGMSTVGTRRKDSAATLACGAYKLYGTQACTNHHISYESLYEAVRKAICKAIELSVDEEARLLDWLLQAGTSAQEKNQSARQQARQNLLQEAGAMAAKIERLYDDKYADRIASAQFQSLLQKYQRQEKILHAALAQSAPSPKEGCAAGDAQRDDMTHLIKQYTKPESLNPRILHALIDSILVHQGENAESETGAVVRKTRVDIHFRFSCVAQTISIDV